MRLYNLSHGEVVETVVLPSGVERASLDLSKGGFSKATFIGVKAGLKGWIMPPNGGINYISCDQPST